MSTIHDPTLTFLTIDILCILSIFDILLTFRHLTSYWKHLNQLQGYFYILKELICQAKYKEIKLKLEHKSARSANIANFEQLREN